MPEEKKTEAKAEVTQTTKSSGDSNDTLMGVLAYLGILCLIPLLAAKDSDFAQFHAKQGVTLFALEVAAVVLMWVIGFISIAGGLGFLGLLSLVIWLAQIGFLVLSIIGIVNVINKKKEPLPIVGGIHLIK